jgi:polyphosphate glucokinase
MKTTPSQLKILSIDIGGSNIKGTVLNEKGELQMDYEKIPTPHPADPQSVLKAIQTLIKNFPPHDRVSIGFPGFVKNGVVKTAPNLGTPLWQDFDFAKQTEKSLGKLTQVVNDADMQGLGVVKGKGLEMVITLGTGFGTALLMDGNLLPHLEFSHQPFGKFDSYDEYMGDIALKKVGGKKWNKRMKKVFEVLKTVFNYDFLYIGGGNSDKLTFELDKNMKIVTNADGIKGGSRLWVKVDMPARSKPETDLK